MKVILRKNQVIITILAALIAVAGYLNYVDNNANRLADTVDATTTYNNSGINDEDVDISDISDADIQAGQNEPSGEETASGEETTSGNESEDIVSNDSDIIAEPGQAIIVNGTSTLNFAITARLSREQVRAGNKELLMTIINNENVTDEEKQEVIQQLISLTENAEKENAAETLLDAKGYDNAVVTITSSGVDVVVGAGELTDVQRAQIEDVVKRKAEVSADKITITTFSE
ncbi:MAG: SpoIIIAH-like family protein [Lachnospiraceae bacterium]|nr:SpoIIIAH-like family protein [Lachnospiraceae bacterium]